MKLNSGVDIDIYIYPSQFTNSKFIPDTVYCPINSSANRGKKISIILSARCFGHCVAGRQPGHVQEINSRGVLSCCWAAGR